MLNDELILSSLQLTAGQRVVDAGCGNGYMAGKISKYLGKTGKLYGLERTEESIRVLKDQVQKNNIEFLVGDITRTTTIKNNSVDLVYLSLVFHIFSASQIVGFEQEVRRILKAGGHLAIVNIEKTATSFGPPLDQRSSPEELIEKLSLVPEFCIKVAEHFYMQLFRL